MKVIIECDGTADFSKEYSVGTMRENIAVMNALDVSDGYHTFDELYDHRITLYIALCKALQKPLHYGDIRNTPAGQGMLVWRSTRHSDGEICFGTGTQYILGIGRKTGEQITYHIPIERWNETDFAETLRKASEWDGHSSSDVLGRLALL